MKEDHVDKHIEEEEEERTVQRQDESVKDVAWKAEAHGRRAATEGKTRGKGRKEKGKEM